MSQSPVPRPPERTVIPSAPKALRRFIRDQAERADQLLSMGKSLLGKHGAKLSEPVRESLQAQLATLSAARPKDLKDIDAAALTTAADAFEAGLDEHLGRYRKSVVREYAEAIFWAVLLTLVIRAFVFEAFKIPTGSMIPTLQIHDHLFVNKFIYGLKIPFTRVKFLTFRDPRPGEVIVFEYPYDNDTSTGNDLIKRVIGAPGDRIRMVDYQIFRNGKPVPRKAIANPGEFHDIGRARWPYVAEQECINGIVYTTQHGTGGDVKDWPPDEPDAQFPHAQVYSRAERKDSPDYVVPPGNLLVMGDNRDNSQDGRFFGLVPLDTVKGKAGFLWWAFDADAWYSPTFSRMGNFVHQERPEGTCEGF